MIIVPNMGYRWVLVLMSLLTHVSPIANSSSPPLTFGMLTSSSPARKWLSGKSGRPYFRVFEFQGTRRASLPGGITDGVNWSRAAEGASLGVWRSAGGWYYYRHTDVTTSTARVRQTCLLPLLLHQVIVYAYPPLCYHHDQYTPIAVYLAWTFICVCQIRHLLTPIPWIWR